MDETTYSDQRVIDLINERFVPVRVDNDQRPDVNARYNMGGWPSTVVLSEDGEILQGGTYVPPERLSALLEAISGIYADPSAKLELAGRIRRARDERAARPVAAVDGTLGAVDVAIAERVFERISVEYDDEFGGFGDEPKFPQTTVLHFLLDRCARARGGDARAQEMVAKTLRAMAAGGTYDHVWGGFFRYSTTRDWSVPHFEKMLEDLGGLVFACARAAAMFGDERLRDVTADCVRYLDEHLWQHGAGYGGSQDADEEFYALDAEQRALKQAPYVDPIVYTAWNMETARALLLSEALLSPDRGAVPWRDRALAVMERLWSAAMADGLFCRYLEGAAHVRGLLVDQAWAAMAALSAFEATGDARWLERCRSLLDACDALYDDGLGGYVDRLRDAPAPGKLSDPHVPHDENALMARVLARFARLTADEVRAKRGAAIVARLARVARGLGRFGAGIGSALLEVAEPPVEVVVVGAADDPRTAALRTAALARPRPALIVNTLDPGRDARRLSALGHEPTDRPIAFLCTAWACFARAHSPHELVAALEAAPVT